MFVLSAACSNYRPQQSVFPRNVLRHLRLHAHCYPCYDHFKTTVPLSVLMPTALMPGGPSTQRSGSLSVPIHSSVAFLSPASSMYSMPRGLTLCSAGLCIMNQQLWMPPMCRSKTGSRQASSRHTSIRQSPSQEELLLHSFQCDRDRPRKRAPDQHGSG